MYFAIFTCGCLSTLNSLSVIFGNRERFLLQINSWMEDIHRASGPNDRPRVWMHSFGCCKSLTSSLEGQFNTWLSKCLVIEIIALLNVRMPLKLLCILAFVSISRWSNFIPSYYVKKTSTKFSTQNLFNPPTPDLWCCYIWLNVLFYQWLNVFIGTYNFWAQR